MTWIKDAAREIELQRLSGQDEIAACIKRYASNACAALKRSRQGWLNAIELGILPKQYHEEPEPESPYRNRIIDHRRVRAGDLLPHDMNFRTHPQSQTDALLGVYEEVGFARSLLAYETADGLKLISCG